MRTRANEESLYIAENGYKAMVKIGTEAEKNGTSEMTPDEINAEIGDSRRKRRMSE